MDSIRCSGLMVGIGVQNPVTTLYTINASNASAGDKKQNEEVETVHAWSGSRIE